MSQIQKIMDYMKEHGSIDQCRAVKDLDCYRLGARIYDMKAAGIPVVSVRRQRLDNDGRVVKQWSEDDICLRDTWMVGNTTRYWRYGQ